MAKRVCPDLYFPQIEAEPAKPTGNEQFASLPPETRMLIREYLFYSELPIRPVQSVPGSCQFLARVNGEDSEFGRALAAFQRTCKLFYFDHETYPTFYEVNTFAFDDEQPLVNYVAAITPSRRLALRSLMLIRPARSWDWEGRHLPRFGQGSLSLCKNIKKLNIKEVEGIGYANRRRVHPGASTYRGPASVNRLLLHYINLLPNLEEIKASGDYEFNATWEALVSKSSLDCLTWRRRPDRLSIAWYTFNSRPTRIPTVSEMRLQLEPSWMALREERAQSAWFNIKDQANKEFFRAQIHRFGEGRYGPDRKPQFLASRTRRGSAMDLTNQGIPRSIDTKPDYRPVNTSDYRLAEDESLELRVRPQGRIPVLRGPTDLHPTKTFRVSTGSSKATWTSLRAVLRPEDPDHVTYDAAMDLYDDIWDILGRQIRRKPAQRCPPPNPRYYLSEAIKDLAWENVQAEAAFLEKLDRLEARWERLYPKAQS